jgi:hypothetical protein
MHTSASPSRIKLPGFFVFWWSYTDVSGVTRDCAICFKAPGAVQPSAWIDLIEEVSKGPEIPDAVIFVYLDLDSENYLKGKRDETVATYLQRFEGRISSFESKFGLVKNAIDTTTLLNLSTRKEEIEWSKRVKNEFSDILQTGLNRIFTAEEVIVEAPPGFQFIKHSGGVAKKLDLFYVQSRG